MGTNLDYGSLIQFGGDVEVEVSQEVIDCVLQYMEEHPERADRRMRQFAKKGPHTFTISVPARPFISVEDDELDDLEDIARGIIS